MAWGASSRLFRARNEAGGAERAAATHEIVVGSVLLGEASKRTGAALGSGGGRPNVARAMRGPRRWVRASDRALNVARLRMGAPGTMSDVHGGVALMSGT